MTEEERRKEKELKFMIHLIDDQIKNLKKEKIIYVDELNSLGTPKKKVKYDRRYQNRKKHT